MAMSCYFGDRPAAVPTIVKENLRDSIFSGEGDRAGNAVIIEGLPNCICENPPPPVQIATLYMKTYCMACKREGFIGPKGPRRPGTAFNGKPWALSGDINICGCNPPPVFYAERGMSMTFTAEEVATLTCGGTLAIATSIAADAKTDQ